MSAGISGRAEPLPGQGLPPVKHDVLFYGIGDAGSGGHEGLIIAECRPCHWRTTLRGGYGAAQLTTLAGMHSGSEAA